jgi:hypothetical protein
MGQAPSWHHWRRQTRLQRWKMVRLSFLRSSFRPFFQLRCPLLSPSASPFPKTKNYMPGRLRQSRINPMENGAKIAYTDFAQTARAL